MNTAKNNPYKTEMPDLPIQDLVANQKTVIKFWVDHCKNLEEKIHSLQLQLAELHKSTLQY